MNKEIIEIEKKKVFCIVGTMKILYMYTCVVTISAILFSHRNQIFFSFSVEVKEFKLSID